MDSGGGREGREEHGNLVSWSSNMRVAAGVVKNVRVREGARRFIAGRLTLHPPTHPPTHPQPGHLLLVACSLLCRHGHGGGTGTSCRDAA